MTTSSKVEDVCSPHNSSYILRNIPYRNLHIYIQEIGTRMFEVALLVIAEILEKTLVFFNRRMDEYL